MRIVSLPLSLTAALALSAVACKPMPSDVRCAKMPPAGANYGECFLILGAYYDPRDGTCHEASGCTCDAACRDNELPFVSADECNQVCLGEATAN